MKFRISKQKLPDGWKWIRLGDICEFKYGKSLPQKNRVEGNFPVYGSNGVIGFHNSFLTQGKTIVIGRKGSVGEINTSSDSCWPIDTTYYIDSIRKDIYWDWFVYCLNILNLPELNKAAAIPGLNRNDAYSISFPLPPLPIQRRIAEVLDRADRIRRLRQRAIEKMDELIRSTFLEMFGDPVRNPMGWEVDKLINHIELKGGYAFKSSDFVYKGIPLVRIGNANKKDFDTTNIVYLPFNFNKKYKKFVLNPGDFVITLTGTTGKDDYGNVSIIPDIFSEWLLNQRIAKIIISSNKLNKSFLFHFLRHPFVKSNIIRVSRGIRQANLNNQDIYSQKILLPPITIQNKFSKLMGKINQKKNEYVNFIHNSDKLFSSLLQRAFRGELEFYDEAFTAMENPQ